jgi:hypothetical protein
MASIAPTVLFCERCKYKRNDVDTGSLVGDADPCADAAAAGVFAVGAGPWAKARVLQTKKQAATTRLRFTGTLLRLFIIYRNSGQVIRLRRTGNDTKERERYKTPHNKMNSPVNLCVLCG